MISVSVICQEAGSKDQKSVRKQKRAEKVEQGKFMAFPIAAPAYTPDHYWGVGYDNASSNPGRDETTAYTHSMWKINPRVLWQFRDDVFLGLSIDYNRTKASDVNSNIETDPGFLKFGPTNFNSGFGIILRYDSCDIPVNAWSGTLIDLQVIRYTPVYGKLSRHGMVGWLGTGSIGATPSEFNHWIPNAGLGYRYEVQPRMNVRAEIGIGKNSRGFDFCFMGI